MRVKSTIISARSIAASAGLLVGLAASPTLAQTFWSSAQNGTWGNPANWSAGVPTSAVDAFITVQGPPSYQVTLNAAFTARSLTLGNAVVNSDATLALSNRTLTLRNGYTQNGSVLLGNIATRPQNFLSISGPTTLNSAVLMASTVLTRGPLQFIGGDNDICDTDMDHRGSSASWSGAGNILLHGASGRFTNNFASTFTISNDQTVVTDSTGQFINNGRLIKSTGAGTTFFDFTLGGALTNVGTIEVQTGTLRANALSAATFSGGTLNTGTWNVLNGRTLQLDGVSITTTNASIVLSGASSTFAAIDGLSTIGTGGRFTIQNGRDFTTVGDFTNSGTLTIGAAQTFRVAPTFALTNLAAGTLAGGTFNLLGRVQVDGASISTLDAKLTLDGVNSGIIDEAAGDALAALSAAQAASELTVRGGRILTTTAPTFTIASGARLTVGSGSRLTLNVLDAATFSANRLSNAVLDVSGIFQFDGADVRELATSLTLNGPAAAIRDESNASGLAGFNRINATGQLSLLGGQQLTIAAFNMDAGARLTLDGTGTSLVAGTFAEGAGGTLAPGRTITVGRGATLQYTGAAFTSVPAGLNVRPGGRVLDENNVDAFNALNNIQGDATFGVATGETRTLAAGLSIDTGGTLLVGEQGGVSGAILNVNGALTQNGSTNLGNGQLNISGNYALGGTLSGDGIITAPATSVSGKIAPGHSPDDLTFNSNLTILAGSFLEFELGAPDGAAPPGDLSDFILVNGTVQFDAGLAGTVNYNFINAFEPEVGDTFVLLRATGGITGLPAGVVPLGTDIGASISIVAGTDLVLTVTALPSPGGAGLTLLAAVCAGRRRRRA
ncbi:MAG: beta strand repeat-containing protein [Phycisphaerales bacterium]